jgi:hypothetical protein
MSLVSLSNTLEHGSILECACWLHCLDRDRESPKISDTTSQAESRSCSPRILPIAETFLQNLHSFCKRYTRPNPRVTIKILTKATSRKYKVLHLIVRKPQTLEFRVQITPYTIMISCQLILNIRAQAPAQIQWYKRATTAILVHI